MVLWIDSTETEPKTEIESGDLVTRVVVQLNRGQLAPLPALQTVYPCGCTANRTCDECKEAAYYCTDLFYDIEGEILDALVSASFFVTDSFAGPVDEFEHETARG